MFLTTKEKIMILLDRRCCHNFEDYWKDLITYEEYEQRNEEYENYLNKLDEERLAQEFADLISI